MVCCSAKISNQTSPKETLPFYKTPSRVVCVALGVIALVAGAVAFGLLFPQIGYAALGFAGCGLLLGAALTTLGVGCIDHLELPCSNVETFGSPNDSSPLNQLYLKVHDMLRQQEEKWDDRKKVGEI